MLNDSKDILNITLAASAGILSLAIALSFFYLAMILRRFMKISDEIHGALRKVDEILTALKEKIEMSASYLLLIGEGVKKMVEIARDFSADKKSKLK